MNGSAEALPLANVRYRFMFHGRLTVAPSLGRNVLSQLAVATGPRDHWTIETFGEDMTCARLSFHIHGVPRT